MTSGYDDSDSPLKSTAFSTTVTLLAASTLTVMAALIVAPALPYISAEFVGRSGLSILVPLVVTLPALVVSISAPIAGLFADKYGAHLVLAVGAAVFAVAGVAGGLAPTIDLLLLSRGLIGFGVAGVMTGVTTLIAHLYVDLQRERMLSLQAAVMVGLSTLFLLLSGLLIVWFGWRAAFFLYCAAFPLPYLVYRYVPFPISRPAAGSGSFVEEVTVWPRLRDLLSRSHRSTGTLSTVPVFEAWLLVAYPLMFVTQVLIYMFPVYVPFILDKYYDISASGSSLIIALAPVAYALGSLSHIRLGPATSRSTLLSLGLFLSGLGYVFVGLSETFLMLLPGLMLGGFGIGVLVPAIIGWVARLSPLTLRGRMLGLLTSVMFLGQFSSALVWGPLVRRSGETYAFGVAGLSMGVVSVAILVVVLFLSAYRATRD